MSLSYPPILLVLILIPLLSSVAEAAFTSEEDLVDLPVRRCCQFPKLLAGGSCTGGEGNEDQTTPATLSIRTTQEDVHLPPYLLPQKYANTSVTLRIRDSESLSCSKGNTSFTLSLRDGETPEEFLETLQFLPYNGYFKYGPHNFHPNDYCVHKTDEVTMEVVTCDPECSVSRPCITKCCDLDEVWDISKYPHVKCADAGGLLWTPRVFANAHETSPLNASSFTPHVITHHPRIWYTGSLNIHSLTDIPPDKRKLFKTLPDGSVWMKMNQVEWKPLPAGNFCIDGAENFPSSLGTQMETSIGTGGFSGNYADTIVLFCGDCTSGYSFCEVHSSPYLYGLSLLGASCFLLITMAVYVMLWERQNVHGWTSLSYFSSLFAMFLLTGVDQFGYLFFYEGDDHANWACYSLAVATHFFWLSSFCWMSAVNFDLWWTFRALLPTASKSKGLKQFLFYAVFCVGIPTVIVLVAVVLDTVYKDDWESYVITPRYAVRRCFLEGEWAPLPYLYGPISILMMCNLVFFAVTVFDMYKIQQSTKFAAVSSSKNSGQSQSAFLFFKLFLLMGIPWTFDVISWATSKCGDTAWYWKIFDMINIFQAVAIFITFVCKSETKKALISKYPVIQRIFSALAIQPDTAQQILDKRPGLKFLIKPFTRRRKSRGTFSSGKTHSTSLDLSRRASRNTPDL